MGELAMSTSVWQVSFHALRVDGVCSGGSLRFESTFGLKDEVADELLAKLGVTKWYGSIVLINSVRPQKEA